MTRHIASLITDKGILHYLYIRTRRGIFRITSAHLNPDNEMILTPLSEPECEQDIASRSKYMDELILARHIEDTALSPQIMNHIAETLIDGLRTEAA